MIEAITPELHNQLMAAGFNTFYQLVLVSIEDLSQVKGIDNRTSMEIKDMVNYLIKYYEEEVEDYE